jgi:hypothetical protein
VLLGTSLHCSSCSLISSSTTCPQAQQNSCNTSFRFQAAQRSMQRSAPGVQQTASCSTILRRVPHTCRRPPHGHQPLHKPLSFQSAVHEPNWLVNFPKLSSMYSRTPLVRINSDGKPSGYAENPDNWILFENWLRWQFRVRLLLFTVCTCV